MALFDTGKESDTSDRNTACATCSTVAASHVVKRNSSPVRAKFILRGQALGFSALVVLMWTVEVLDVPHYLYGDPSEFLLVRPIVRSAVVLFIWLIVHLTTKRLLQRLHELEEFLHICSWCRKVGHDGDWVTVEDYFGSKFSTETSHGICPECAKQQLAQFIAEDRAKTCKSVPPRPPTQQ